MMLKVLATKPGVEDAFFWRAGMMVLPFIEGLMPFTWPLTPFTPLGLLRDPLRVPLDSAIVM